MNKDMEKNLEDYQKNFSVKGLWKKLKASSKKLGIKVVYTILLLFFAYSRDETPRWAKSVVIGSIGYFLSPIDAVPDLTPFLGYTDDIGVLSFGLVTIAAYINEEVKNKAKRQLGSLFGHFEDSALNDIDEKL